MAIRHTHRQHHGRVTSECRFSVDQAASRHRPISPRRPTGRQQRRTPQPRSLPGPARGPAYREHHPPTMICQRVVDCLSPGVTAAAELASDGCAFRRRCTTGGRRSRGRVGPDRTRDRTPAPSSLFVPCQTAAMRALASAGAGFLARVLWFDPVFDIQRLDEHRSVVPFSRGACPRPAGVLPHTIGDRRNVPGTEQRQRTVRCRPSSDQRRRVSVGPGRWIGAAIFLHLEGGVPDPSTDSPVRNSSSPVGLLELRRLDRRSVREAKSAATSLGGPATALGWLAASFCFPTAA